MGRREEARDSILLFKPNLSGVFLRQQPALTGRQELSSMGIQSGYLGTLCYSADWPFSYHFPGVLNIFIPLYNFILGGSFSDIAWTSHFTGFQNYSAS